MTKAMNLLCACLCVASAACSDDPTTAVVENGFPAAVDGGTSSKTTVFKVWWSTTLFPTPVAPLTSSEVERTVPATDFAYALLAPGWAPEDGGRPSRLVPVRSVAKLSVATHDRLLIAVSDDTFVGNCAAGKRLSDEDARFVVERIFPGDFAGSLYDPTTCETTSSDGGASDAPSSDASGDASAGDSASDD